MNYTKKHILEITINASIIIQIITGIITLGSFLIKLASQHMILYDIMLMETIVQFVELSFYLLISYYLVNISISNVAALRYFDWVFTTPVMLLTTIMFFDYKNKQVKESMVDTINEEKEDKHDDSQAILFVKENKRNIVLILVYNFLMLLFGYLGEIGSINLYLSNVIGFVFFGLAFYTIWSNYVKESTVLINHQLFYFIFIVWALYGVAALASPFIKNIGYNLLDIVAKNFYGLFIFYQIYLTSI